MLDWLACPQAQGWLGSPWRAGDPLPAEVRGAGLVKSVGVACALARGYVHADAIVLGRMVALQVTRSAQANAIVSSLPDAGFARDASLLPMLSPGRLPRFAPRTVLQREAFSAHAGSDATGNHFDLYALVDSVERLQQVLDAGVRTVQLRIKAPPQLGLHARAPWQAFLYRSVQRSVDACRNFGAELFINDHWMVAQSLGATGVHLGQEDLLALDDVQHAQLMTSGLAIGISTHSLWELCRARSMAPHYVACGPVWPTATKTMPWRAQGLDHLAWWCAMAQTRVVAIGGILDAQRVGKAAQTGVDGVCVLSALGEDPHASVQGLQTALRSGRVSSPPIAPAAFPPASLESVYGRATHVGVNCDCGAWHAACA
jgi:hydroxymethylpyrimidine kinase/phosphomethylpyrimidine kinase/thiamine-phosphate diphosphorylase